MKFTLFFWAVIAVVAADVSHLPPNEYLPPDASAPQPTYANYAAPVETYAPVESYAASAPVQSYSVPAQAAYVDVGASKPAHELSSDGYRYKTRRRVVFRRNRRDVSHLPPNEYLPPHASAPEPTYAAAASAPAPVQSYAAPAPAQTFTAPAPVPTYAASAPVQSYAAPAPVQSYAASAPVPTYAVPAPVESYAASAPVQSYSAPAQAAYVDSGDSEPAHELASDGYRYKTHRRVVYRRNRRDVSHLPPNEYLPPHASAPEPTYAAAASAPAPVQTYAAPVQTYAASAPVESYAASAPAQTYSAPAQAAYVDAGASEPAHELASDGYRYKTRRRVVYRRNRRDVSQEYLPPYQTAPSEPSVEYLPPVHEAEIIPAHSYAENDGYRYRTNRRRVYRRHR